MRSKYVRHAVDLQEFLDHVPTKRVTCAPGRQGELVSLWIGVTPNQIRHRSFVWNFPEPIDDFDLVNGVYTRT